MPAILVTVDGQHLATVATGGLNMLGFHLIGQRWDEQLADLTMNGGFYGSEQASPMLTWLDCVPLRAGQVIAVSCVADTASSHAGKTIDELHPDAAPCAQTDFTPTAAMFEEMGQRPMLRAGYAFKLAPSHGADYTGHTDADEYGFTLRVTWTALHRPDCARFSVSTNTVEQLRTRSPARKHVEGQLFIGQGFRFQFWPAA